MWMRFASPAKPNYCEKCRHAHLFSTRTTRLGVVLLDELAQYLITHVPPREETRRDYTNMLNRELEQDAPVLLGTHRCGLTRLCTTRSTRRGDVLLDRLCAKFKPTNQVPPRERGRRLTNMLNRELNVDAPSLAKLTRTDNADILACAQKDPQCWENWWLTDCL